MKNCSFYLRLWLVSFLVAFILNFGLSQTNDFCGTIVQAPPQEALLCEVVDDPLTKFYINIYMHVITDIHGEGGYSNDGVKAAFETLKAAFEPQNIFFSWCGDVNEIREDVYISANSLGALSNIFNDSYSDPNGIDIYLFQPDHSVKGGIAGGNASASGELGTTQLLIAGRTAQGSADPYALTPIIVHEMGHLLGLYHTFEVVFGIDTDGSDCLNTGDLMCNTPPDPGLSSVDVEDYCVWGGDDNFSPDVHNFMSYSLLECMNRFQDDQIQKMRDNLQYSPFLQPILADPATMACSCGTTSITIIDEDTEYNENRSFGNDIYIRNGATLTINNASLFFTENAGIRVLGDSKLVLNGATLTKCILGESWQGVKVDGSINLFGVAHSGGWFEALNNSLIEYAKIGVKSQMDSENGLLGLEYGGGKVILDNSNIENCGIGLLLGSSEQNSYDIINGSVIFPLYFAERMNFVTAFH